MLGLTRVIFQLDVLEQDALDLLLLVRSLKNRMAPINQIPPEILSLVPDFLDPYDDKDQDVIALTHVCQAWRELFVSRPSLWTDLDDVDLDKTRVYLERSKSSPISLSLDSGNDSLSDPFFEFIPGAAGRLKSLDIDVELEDMQLITTYLSRPTPLLESLRMRGGRNPVLQSSLFNGDLSSLHELYLTHVHTELPWRNMVNLTSFILGYTSPPVTVSQLLDFFESAPHLREVDLLSSTPISGTGNGRLVSLASLQRMDTSSHSSSHLFDHLLIPVGARLKMGVDLPSPPVEGRTPRFIDNLRNLSNFTAIEFCYGSAGTKFSGPNGKVWMVPKDSLTCLALESSGYFDTSKIEWLKIDWAPSPTSDRLSRALLPMKTLRTLTIYGWDDPCILVLALDPSMSSSGVVICPKLEELIIEHWVKFDIKCIMRAVAARASRGAKLETLRIVLRGSAAVSQLDKMELEKHVSHVQLTR